jgi:hypothetical protein
MMALLNVTPGYCVVRMVLSLKPSKSIKMVLAERQLAEHRKATTTAATLIPCGLQGNIDVKGTRFRTGHFLL